MKTAIWFSRHHPTVEQLADAQARGCEITSVDAGIHAGSANLAEQPDVWAAMEYCRGHTVLGVFPSPLRAAWFAAPTQAPVEAWESWNVQRTQEGGKPTFLHREWVRVW